MSVYHHFKQIENPEPDPESEVSGKVRYEALSPARYLTKKQMMMLKGMRPQLRADIGLSMTGGYEINFRRIGTTILRDMD